MQGVIFLPPKPKVTKESIVNAAFEILRKEGIDKINARAVCERLNCSTQPIFWHFKNMEELKDETIRKAKDLYNEYIQTALKEPLPFKAAGLAYIKFAKDEPLLFSLLFMKDNHNINPGGTEYDENYNEVLSAAESSSGLSQKNTKILYFHLWIYVHGIATLIATKTEIFTDEQISSMLTAAYQAFTEKYNEEEN